MSAYSSIPGLRILILPWLTLWIMVVPLVHVHPEADHRHGNADHVHGGTIHTVFSPDLPCEFVAHSRVADSQGNSSESFNVVGQAAHVFNHLEIHYFLLPSSIDRPQDKTTTPDATDFREESASANAAYSTVLPQGVYRPTGLFPVSDLSARAPPFLVA